MSRRQGEAFMDEEESMEEILGLKKQTASLKQSKLSSNMNAIAVLDMIKNLQDEIEVTIIFNNNFLLSLLVF